jgi:hypothetical protein
MVLFGSLGLSRKGKSGSFSLVTWLLVENVSFQTVQNISLPPSQELPNILVQRTPSSVSRHRPSLTCPPIGLRLERLAC